MNALAAGSDTGDDDVFARIAQAIERQGYAIVDGALPASIVDALFVHFTALPDDALTRAGIGREDAHQLNRFVRTDDTHWLDAVQAADRAFLGWMETLRLGINRHLYLGLFDYEAHYARYAPGAFYRRHLDAFDGSHRNRVLSTVLYLNPSWQPGDGGEMLLYAPGDGGGLLATVEPVYGRLAVFLSESFPHEVVATQRTRYSIAGWFRVNNSIDGIDPAR
ncbi:MAG: 2OG-Fe(II) oxygenase [Gammaproteobacteria bacterium]|nr:2OG-Fe(II) oxygenase [Gammaproteobacteria bacterium]MCB1923857.1 2OG-Fe(II) oxygenase [Gammaproteobacteria bacterium]